MSRRLRDFLAALAVVVLFALPLVPEILGARLLVFRDAQITHWPWRRVAVAALRRGRGAVRQRGRFRRSAAARQPERRAALSDLPARRSSLGAGAAFNLHYLVHVLWAFFGARALARRLGMADGPSFVAGIAFAFSGMMLVVRVGLHEFRRRGGVASLVRRRLPRPRTGAGRARQGLPRRSRPGLALGLQLLAGEPAISLLTLAVGRRARSPPTRCRARSARGPAGSPAPPPHAWRQAASRWRSRRRCSCPCAPSLPLTYRGQHSFSERAFGAAAFSPSRAIEWLLPRFGGDPDLLGGGANWLRAIGAAGLRLHLVRHVRRRAAPAGPARCPAPGVLEPRSGALAVGAAAALALAFGFSLPFYRLIYAVESLRKLRYPIKFYLLTTLCVALLAGLAAQALGRRRPGRREALAIGILLAVFAAAWGLAGPGGALDRWAEPIAAGISDNPPGFLAAFRGFVRGRRPHRGARRARRRPRPRPAARPEPSRTGVGARLPRASLGVHLGTAPLRVGADEGPRPAPRADPPDGRPGPALRFRFPSPLRLRAPSGSTRREAFPARAGSRASSSSSSFRPRERPSACTTSSRTTRTAPTDTSTGWRARPRAPRHRSSATACSCSTERGGRSPTDSEEHPLFHAATGLEVAGEHLVLFENPQPVAELRWAGRAWRPPRPLGHARARALGALRSAAGHRASRETGRGSWRFRRAAVWTSSLSAPTTPRRPSRRRAPGT